MPGVFRLGLILGLFVLVLILVNIYVLVPQMTEQPRQSTRVQEEVPYRVRTENILIKDTLTDMKSPAAVDQEHTRFNFGTGGRNPFFWPGEERKKAVVKKVVAPRKVVLRQEKEKPQLSMVIVGAQGRKALLDDTFVSEGELFHDYLVKRIGPDKIILADKYGELSIQLGVQKDKGKTEPEPAGLIER